MRDRRPRSSIEPDGQAAAGKWRRNRRQRREKSRFATVRAGEFIAKSENAREVSLEIAHLGALS
jgi:hypothetical protein